MNTLLIVIYVSIIAICVSFRKSNVAFILAFILAWVLIAGNFQNSDYDNYLVRYEKSSDLKLDLGFSYICSFFYERGFSFTQFKSIVSLICLFLVFRAISMLSREKALIAGMFIIFPFLIDITQFRGFVSYSVLFAGLPYLFENKKSSLIKYYIFAVLATTIHAASVFYLLLPLVRKKIDWKFAVVGVVVLFLVKEFLTTYFQLSFETDKLDAFDKPTLAGALFGSFVVILNAVVINLISKKFNGVSEKQDNPYGLDYLMPRISLLVLLIIPFLFDNGNYSRIYRNLLVLNLIYFSNALYLRRQTRYLLIVVYVAFFAYGSLFAGTYFDQVVKPIFTYNSFLGF